MSWTVKTPVNGFTGNVAGVDFQNGVGTCDSDISYFQRHGYEITEDQPVEDQPVEDQTAKPKNTTVKK